jgi:hypothetical protein
MYDVSLLSQIFEALPWPTFLVDDDVQILLANRAGRELARLESTTPTGGLKRGGEALHCVHATDHPDGCGRGRACQHCVVRGSVGEALKNGAVSRRETVMELGTGADLRRLTLEVSTAPIEFEGTHLAVLTLEDVSDLARLKSMIPRCATCGRLSIPDEAWHEIATLIGERQRVGPATDRCASCAGEASPSRGLGA